MIVVDTSAIVAIMLGEGAALELVEKIQSAEEPVVSPASYLERIMVLS